MEYVGSFFDLLPCAGLTTFVAFDIQGADEHGPAYSNERINMAPSRPPSRASNNKSPLSKVIDLTAEHAAGLYALRLD